MIYLLGAVALFIFMAYMGRRVDKEYDKYVRSPEGIAAAKKRAEEHEPGSYEAKRRLV